MKPDVYYHIVMVSGTSVRVRIPPDVISPFRAIEHNVPFFAWPVANEDRSERIIFNPRNVEYVQEIDPPEEAF